MKVIVVDLHPERQLGGSERVLRAFCRFAGNWHEIRWLGASYQYFTFLNIIYSMLGLPTSSLTEMDDSPGNAAIDRLTVVTFLPLSPQWRAVRRHLREADAIYCKNELFELLVVYYFGGMHALRKTTVVMHSAIALPDEEKGTWRTVHDFLYRSSLYRFFLRFAKSIHGVSSSVHDDLRYIGLNDRSVSYIGWPVFVTGEPAEQKAPGFRIGFAGRFSEQKGIRFLIGLAEQLAKTDIEILVAGAGELDDLVKEAADRLPNFKLKGLVRDIATFFSEVSVVLVPSKWEGVGTVCAEGFFCNLPVVAFAISGNKDIFKTARCEDLLISCFDVQQMVDKVLSLRASCERDPSVFKQRFLEAGQRVRSAYAPEAVFKSTLRDLEALA